MITKINELEWKHKQLWQGCILATIAHAIMVAHFPELSNEHSWDGINYNVQDSEGTRGTITFDSKYCVAAFRNDDSGRILTSKFSEAHKYFQGASLEILQLAEAEALQYLLENVNGRAVPVITTAFWGEDNNLFTNDTYNEMIENGGFLLERQVMGFDLAIEAWKEYYDMSQQQCDFLKYIYDRKISNPNEIITLSKEEISFIGSNDEEGLNESRISFEEIGIQWEE
jgi:hypothetical protein